MATRRASTRVSNGSSSSGPHSPDEPSGPRQGEKRRAPPPVTVIDEDDEEAVFGIKNKKMRQQINQELPISASQTIQQPTPAPAPSSVDPPPQPPAAKPTRKKAGSRKPTKLDIQPIPPPTRSSQTPPSPSSQPLPPRQSTSTAPGLMLPPTRPPPRKPAASRPSMVAKAVRSLDDDDEDESVAPGPSVSKKPRSKGKAVAGSAPDDEPEEGLEGKRLMDEMAEEHTKRKKVTGRAPAFEILSFAVPKPKSSSKPFTLPPPPKPSTSHGVSGDVSGDSTVPIQISDTPMIRKNQEMRKNVSKRNSFSQRGARASASFGKGEATAPHPQVVTSDFYKHIDGEEPEAIRMRHLLVFVGKRVASTLAATGSVDGSSSSTDAKGKGKAKAPKTPRTQRGEIIAGEVMEDVLRMLVKAKVDTNPQSSGASSFLLPKKPTAPHPGNVQNKKVEITYEQFRQKGRAEEALWSAAVKSANALQTRTCEAIVHKVTTTDWADSLLDGLTDPVDVQAAQLAKLVLSRDSGANAPDDLEYSIHTMEQITQTAVQVSNESTRLMDSLFANLALTLRARDAVGRTSSTSASHLFPLSTAAGSGSSSTLNPTSTPSDDPMATLRALASRASAHPRPETLKAAAALASLPPPSSGSGLPPTTPRRVAHPPTTPRRGAGTTPFQSRRTPGASSADTSASTQ